MDTHICNKCKIEKTMNHFNFSVTTGYYTYTCKECLSIRRKQTRDAIKQKTSALEICEDEITKQNAELLLRSMGYELYNPENPVYLQFERRSLMRYGVDLSK